MEEEKNVVLYNVSPTGDIFINISGIKERITELQEENKQLKSVNLFSKRKLYKMNKDRLEANLKLVNENKQLKEKINTYEDPEDLTLMFMYCDEKAKDKIKELEEENFKLQARADKYKCRNNKAIEYIKGAYEMALYTNTVCLDEDNIEELLEILKGGNNGETK